jgi:gamma-glutamyltranspeptidase/glutathione hydrolase
VSASYRDHEILSNPLPSSGGTLIAFTLGLLNGLELPPDDPARRAAALVGAFKGTDSARREMFDSCLNEEDFASRFLSPQVMNRYLGSTTHISAIDAEGRAVALTSSCGSGSGVVVEGTGIIMNNMGGEEDLNPGGAFALPPGNRLTSMMAPTLARRTGADQHLLALGSAGSARLRSAIVQTLVNVLDLSLPAQEAVDRPRVHVDGDTVHLEGGTPARVAHYLEEKGERVNVWPILDLYFGGVQIASRCRREGEVTFDGGADPRRGGAALFA